MIDIKKLRDNLEDIKNALKKRGYELDESSFKSLDDSRKELQVDVEGLPKIYMDGNSPSQVKAHLRKLVKQPSMIKSVNRMTTHNIKKVYRDKAAGKEEE